MVSWSNFPPLNMVTAAARDRLCLFFAIVRQYLGHRPASSSLAPVNHTLVIKYTDDIRGPVVGWHRFPSPYQPLRHGHIVQ